jgi:hypothetical protein
MPWDIFANKCPIYDIYAYILHITYVSAPSLKNSLLVLILEYTYIQPAPFAIHIQAKKLDFKIFFFSGLGVSFISLVFKI